MKWRGLVTRLRNGFNMQEEEEGEDEEGKKKKMFHSGCQRQIQVFAAEAVFPGTESAIAGGLEALMLSIC